MAIYSDYVWIGHIFEFLDLQTVDDIAGSIHTYYKGKKELTVMSNEIRFNEAPILQVNTRLFYYWGGVGCKNKCRFCVTSWTERHQAQSRLVDKIEHVRRKVGSHGSVKVISNEYAEAIERSKVQDMMLQDYLNIDHASGKQTKIRLGVEFATEEARKKNGKPMTDADIRLAIKKAGQFNHELQLFCITGLNTREEWFQFVENCIPEDDRLRPRVFIKFTNLDYQQKTPLWKDAKKVNFDNYFDMAFSNRIFEKACFKNKRIRLFPLKYPAHAVWRMCASNIDNESEYVIIKKNRNNRDMDEMIKIFYDLKIPDRKADYFLSGVREVLDYERGNAEGKKP
jgi:radical SAM superfamily enzyme YgiQ (UPF0313 family)